MTVGKLLGARLIGRILALLVTIRISPLNQHMTLLMTILGLTGHKGRTMNKLFKNTNPETLNALYVFEHNGMVIDNPLWNSEMTSHVNPEYYGFKIWDTGGGCTAHGQEFLLDGETVVMLLTDGNLHHVDDDTLIATVGLYDQNVEELPGKLYWEVTR